MSTRPKRLSATEKQRMLVQYLKDGTVPEGYYVHEQKNGIIQFRHIRQPKQAPKDPIQSNEAKIKLYKQKIAELEAYNANYKQNPTQGFNQPLPTCSSEYDFEEDIFE